MVAKVLAAVPYTEGLRFQAPYDAGVVHVDVVDVVSQAPSPAAPDSTAAADESTGPATQSTPATEQTTASAPQPNTSEQQTAKPAAPTLTEVAKSQSPREKLGESKFILPRDAKAFGDANSSRVLVQTEQGEIVGQLQINARRKRNPLALFFPEYQNSVTVKFGTIDDKRPSAPPYAEAEVQFAASEYHSEPIVKSMTVGGFRISAQLESPTIAIEKNGLPVFDTRTLRIEVNVRYADEPEAPAQQSAPVNKK